jgi:hypothetical protein
VQLGARVSRSLDCCLCENDLVKMLWHGCVFSVPYILIIGQDLAIGADFLSVSEWLARNTNKPCVFVRAVRCIAAVDILQCKSVMSII